MLVSLKKLIAASLSFSNKFNNSFKSFLAAYIALSSANFASSASFARNNTLMINMLHEVGPRMDSWGAFDKTILADSHNLSFLVSVSFFSNMSK